MCKPVGHPASDNRPQQDSEGHVGSKGPHPHGSVRSGWNNLEWLCKPPQRCIGSLKGVDVYQTNRQADAEAIVRILHEVTDDDRSAEGYCCLCGEITPDDPPEVHGESCPFGMADEFIAKYGTHPPAEPRRV